MKTFVLALLLRPEVFAKAPEEVDKLTKRERLVDFDDRDSLPYFERVMKEAFGEHQQTTIGCSLWELTTDAFCLLMSNFAFVDGRALFYLVCVSLRANLSPCGPTNSH